MSRRKYLDDYRFTRQTYSPDISPLEQIARTALELHKLLGVDNIDDRYFDSSYRTNDNNYDKFYSLCVSKIPHRLSESDIRDAIYHECKYCGDFNVKISSYNGERVAYINFRSSRQAAKANEGLKNFKIDCKSVRIDPVIHSNTKSRSRSPAYSHNYDHHATNNRRPLEGYSPVRHTRARSRSASRLSGKASNKEARATYSGRDVGAIATRTLFIGNLPLETTEAGLKALFGKFGELTEVDIKKPTGSKQASSYAFIKFENLEVASRAKTEMSGHTVGKCQIKIGFGKVSPTSCVWVGGLGPWILYDAFEQEMGRFGAVKQLQWPHGKNYAYVLYESVDVAIAAVNKLRASSLSTDSDQRTLKVDFADVGAVKTGPAKLVEAPDRGRPLRGPSKQPAACKSTDVSVHTSTCVQQLISCLEDVWTGMIVLKNNNFGCRLFVLKGERAIVHDLMLARRDADHDDARSRVDNLAITQRMKLDRQKLREMGQRIEAAGDSGFCLMLASSYVVDTRLVGDGSQPQRPLKNLITYLRTKESAGVVFLKSNDQSTGVLHAFPPCDFSFEILLQKAPNLTKDYFRDDFLVVLLIKNSA